MPTLYRLFIHLGTFDSLFNMAIAPLTVTYHGIAPLSCPLNTIVQFIVLTNVGISRFLLNYVE